jgi:hypothetical protein
MAEPSQQQAVGAAAVRVDPVHPAVIINLLTFTNLMRQKHCRIFIIF